MIRPLRGLRASAAAAPHLVAPPYDVVSRARTAALCRQSPRSFLHVTRPDAAFDGSSTAATRVDLARRFLDDLVERGDLCLEDRPLYGAMRLERDGHVQTGLLAAVPVENYLAGRVRRHERVLEDKLADRTRHIRDLGAHTGLVMLMHRACTGIDALLDQLTRRRADVAGVTPDGTRHNLWLVTTPDVRQAIDQAYAALETVYIADGHHRTAAAAAVAAEGGGAFPGVLFPAHCLRVLGYHRVVTDTAGLAPGDLLARLERDFHVSGARGPQVPEVPEVLGLCTGGEWYRLRYRGARLGFDTAAELLDRAVLQPILGIDEEARGRRLRYIGGDNGALLLQREVEEIRGAVGFALAPVDTDTIMDIADAGEVLPQKSTWFEPKLADGLVVLPLDEADLGRCGRGRGQRAAG